jgi:hypothetical protein
MFTWLKKLLGMKEEAKTLKGDGTWGFVALVDGDDLVVRGAKATWFGGANDPQDNGETASGISTKKRPEILGCAIPMNFGPCKGSPLPRLPWGTKIEVKHPASGKTITVPVIDLGPARGTGNAIDLTPAAFRQFAPLAVGKVTVEYRISGAAKYLTA